MNNIFIMMLFFHSYIAAEPMLFILGDLFSGDNILIFFGYYVPSTVPYVPFCQNSITDCTVLLLLKN
jgi:hypothetical protein